MCGLEMVRVRYVQWKECHLEHDEGGVHAAVADAQQILGGREEVACLPSGKRRGGQRATSFLKQEGLNL